MSDSTSLIHSIYDLFKKSSGITTDTRKIEKGQLFFALKGPNFNANEFASQAIDQGAMAAIVDELDDKESHKKFILVEDVLTCLQELARHHRQQLTTKIIAIGGSNGKTSTKELCKSVLSTELKCFATPGNLNNHIGLPLSILMIEQEHTHALIEMGANHKGEHEFLCSIAQPDFALVTNNGKDHLEGFGSVDGVIEANAEIFDYIRTTDGVAFVNADDEHLMKKSQYLKRKLYGCGQGAINCRAQIEARFPYLELSMRLDNGESLEVETQLFGGFHLYNCAAAACVGHFFNISTSEISRGIAAYKPANNRTQLLEWNENRVILDAYNANPSSVEAVLNDFELLAADQKAIILGDMLELGNASETEHKHILSICRKIKPEILILIGTEFMKYAGKHKNEFCFENRNAFIEWINEHPMQGYTILIKGSRGLALEKIIDEA